MDQAQLQARALGELARVKVAEARRVKAQAQVRVTAQELGQAQAADREQAHSPESRFRAGKTRTQATPIRRSSRLSNKRHMA
jgi:hypothetical protein